jgi:hypothetical protein
MAAIRSNNAACLASVERPLSLPIARKLPFRFRPDTVVPGRTPERLLLAHPGNAARHV